MPYTHYKARGLGKLPMCAICAGPGEGGRERWQLTHGVSVWLCAMHRSSAFLTRRAGRDFAGSLGAVWSAAGCLTGRRSRALGAHLERVRGARPRERPGSYAWPALRREAEARFARGEAPRAVMADLGGRDLGAWAAGPSLRTLRRWHQEGRWLRPPQPGGGAPAGPGPEGPLRPGEDRELARVEGLGVAARAPRPPCRAGAASDRKVSALEPVAVRAGSRSASSSMSILRATWSLGERDEDVGRAEVAVVLGDLVLEDQWSRNVFQVSSRHQPVVLVEVVAAGG